MTPVGTGPGKKHHIDSLSPPGPRGTQQGHAQGPGHLVALGNTGQQKDKETALHDTSGLDLGFFGHIGDQLPVLF